jgi:DHA1 family bicyclomycin/chloramphenicol resistance-like MFS transporter
MKLTKMREIEFIALISFISAIAALSIDSVLPALPHIADDLGFTSLQQSQFLVSLFVFGMGFGEMVFGPLSDAYGRRPALLLGLAIYCVGTVIALSAKSFEQIVLGRVIHGFGVSGPKIIGRAVVRDRFEGMAMARVMSLVFSVFILVPMLAPALG